jgi:hypothetical protein
LGDNLEVDGGEARKAVVVALRGVLLELLEAVDGGLESGGQMVVLSFSSQR